MMIQAHTHMMIDVCVLQGLEDYINERLACKKADSPGPGEAELTRRDVIKCIQAQKIRFRGVNLSGLDLSKLVRF